MVPTTWFSAAARAVLRYSVHSSLSNLSCGREDRQVNVFIDAQRGAIGITKPGGFRGELFTSLQRINGFKETEAPRQQFLLSVSRPL